MKQKVKLPCRNCITLAMCRPLIKEHNRNNIYNVCWCVLYDKCTLFKKFYELEELWILERKEHILRFFNLEVRPYGLDP
jgi:hypothetical protein